MEAGVARGDQPGADEPDEGGQQRELEPGQA
jgi:hypothetical protein